MPCYPKAITGWCSNSSTNCTQDCSGVWVDGSPPASPSPALPATPPSPPSTPPPKSAAPSSSPAVPDAESPKGVTQYGCTQYGGFHNVAQCETAFPGDRNAQKACADVLYGVFPDQTSPAFQGNLKISNVKLVSCPPSLTSKSGLDGSGGKDHGYLDKDGRVSQWGREEYYMTHYWDCCKPSCAWNDEIIKQNNGGRLAKSLQCANKNGAAVPVEADGEQSSCTDSGTRFMCPSAMPFIQDDILYGFVANDVGLGSDGQKADCGSCYSFDITNSKHPTVRKAIVQVTNKGGMGIVDNSKAAFDFLVPGGGFGDYTGCKPMPGWDNVYKECSGTGATPSAKDNLHGRM